MKIEISQAPGAAVLQVREARIDAACAIDFKEAMREHILNGPPRIVLDLSDVAFIDSSGLGAVVAVRKMVGPDRELELAALSPAVQKVFRLTRMDSVFTIHDAVPAALRTAV